MKRVYLFVFLCHLAISTKAQCDSTSIRQWLRNIDPDTVCFEPIGVCKDNCSKSCIRYMLDSSGYRYEYRDSVTGLWSVRIVNGNQLRELRYNTGKDTIVDLHYDPGRCTASIVLKYIINDSLTRISKKQRTFYEYYSETAYDTNGVLIASWVETIVIKRGKKFRRIVYLRPTHRFNKEKIRMKKA